MFTGKELVIQGTNRKVVAKEKCTLGMTKPGKNECNGCIWCLL